MNLLLAASILTASAALGQDLGIKAPPQSRPIAIVNATLHPVSSDPVPGATILFEKGVITGLGPNVQIPEAALVIDGGGRHVYPGLFSPLTQLGLTEIQAVRASNDMNEVGDFTPESFAAVSVNPDSTLFPVTRSNGILTAASFPTAGRIPGRASVLALDGWTWEDMAILPDAGLILEWPFVRPVTAWWMDRSEDDQRRDIERSLAAIDTLFDAADAYFALRDADPSAPEDLRFEAMRAIRPGASPQRPVFIRASELDQIISALVWAERRALRPVIVGGRDAPLCADLLKARDVPVIVSGTHTFPKRDDSPYDHAFTLPVRLHAAGIRFAIATNDDTAHERNLPYNAAIAVAHGLHPDAALHAVTLAPATIFGLDDRLGSLEVGKAATLILTTGHPLEVTTRVERAFIDGRAIDLSNKHSALADKYREKYRQLKAQEPARR